jgi:hypothetical protein
MSNSDENLKIVLTLLDKAEQILSILNLPDNAVGKYNHMKELAFEKLGIDFYPLISKCRKNNNNKISSENINLNNPQIEKVKLLSARKSILIEFLFDLIEKMKFEDNTYMRQYLLENNLMKQLEKNLNNISKVNHQSMDELEFDLKLEDIKIKDYICKSEIFYKGFINNLSKDKRTHSSEGLDFGDEENRHVEDIVRDYDQRVEEIRRQYEKEFREYKERFNELRIKYNPEIENELFAVRAELQDKNFILDRINEMTMSAYEQHYDKNANWYEEYPNDFKFKELDLVNFLVCLVDKFFNDNKYLIEMLGNLQKDNNMLVDDRNLPFVANAIHKNGLLTQICENTKDVEDNVENFHKNFEDVIDFINKNLENFN